MLARQGLNGDYFGFYFCECCSRSTARGATRFTSNCCPSPAGGAPRNETTPTSNRWAERSPALVGVVGTIIVTCVVVAAFQYNKLPFIKDSNDYSAYFSEAGGIKTGSTVRVSGLGVGGLRCPPGRHQSPVGFTVRKGIKPGDRTEAAIKTETILGAKMLELTTRGEGKLTGTIPCNTSLAV